MYRIPIFIFTFVCACQGRRASEQSASAAPSEVFSRLLLTNNPAGLIHGRNAAFNRRLAPGTTMTLNDGKNHLVKTSAALLAALGAVQSADAARSGGRMGGRVSRGGGGGGYRGGGGATNVYMSPGMGYGMSPFGFSPFGFSPFGFSPFGFGFGFGVPGPILGLALLYLAATAIRERGPGEGGIGADDLPGAALCLQVAVYCRDRSDSLYGKINKIAGSADTSSEYGLQALVSDVGLAMLRSQNEWIAGRTASVTKGFLENKVEESYNRLSVQERTKFENEKRALTRKSSGEPTHMVVTLLVLLRDGSALPEISSLTDMRSAIQDLTAEVSVEDNLMGAEVIWTPEEDNDVMDKDDMFLNFPELVSI